jgi:hypothetical protein
MIHTSRFIVRTIEVGTGIGTSLHLTQGLFYNGSTVQALAKSINLR